MRHRQCRTLQLIIDTQKHQVLRPKGSKTLFSYDLPSTNAALTRITSSKSRTAYVSALLCSSRAFFTCELMAWFPTHFAVRQREPRERKRYKRTANRSRIIVGVLTALLLAQPLYPIRRGFREWNGVCGLRFFLRDVYNKLDKSGACPITLGRMY